MVPPPPVINLPSGNKLLLKPPNSTIAMRFPGFLSFGVAAMRALGYTANSSAIKPPNIQVQLWLHGPDPPAVPACLAEHVQELEQPPAEAVAAVVEALWLRDDKGSTMPKERGNLRVLQLHARAKLYEYVQPPAGNRAVKLSIAVLHHFRGCRYLGVEKVSRLSFGTGDLFGRACMYCCETEVFRKGVLPNVISDSRCTAMT
jgi:hypothetical protein